jgi:protoporphyrinogen oxidase
VRDRVDIVGGGISGLATAWFLARELGEVEIHVWERDRAPGGLAGSFATESFRVEKFYHHLYRRDIALQELIRELGLGDDLLWRPASTGTYYFARPYRLSAPLDLLRFDPLPLADRIRLGLLVLRARRIRDWQALDDLSARDWILRNAGRRVFEVVWEPLLRGKFGAAADQVSAAWLWSKLVDRGGSRDPSGRELLGYLRGGLGRVFDAMVDRLRAAGHHVHLGEPVVALEGRGSRIVRVVSAGGSHEAGIVVSGVQLPDLVPLLPGSGGALRQRAESIRFLGNVCLVLELERPLSDFYWTNVTDPDAPFVGVVEQTNWADRSEFAGLSLAYVSAYVPEGDRRWEMDEDQLHAFYLPHLRRLFPAYRPGLARRRFVWRAHAAQPIVSTGYRHLVPPIETEFENLFVCTMAQIYPHDRQVSNGVEMARQTAASVCRALPSLA